MFDDALQYHGFIGTALLHDYGHYLSILETVLVTAANTTGDSTTPLQFGSFSVSARIPIPLSIPTGL